MFNPINLLALFASLASAYTTTATVPAIYYSPGVMERVARCHMSPSCGAAGDYVPTLRIRGDVDCLVAVNWGSRGLVSRNARIVVDLWDRHQQRWERRYCQAVDWQQNRHASTADRRPDITRLELDFGTADDVNAIPSNTRARVVRIE